MYAADELYDTAALEEAAEADISDHPCSTCGASETVEVFSDDDSMLICAECGSDEP